jgi:hypothetical protein
MALITLERKEIQNNRYFYKAFSYANIQLSALDHCQSLSSTLEQ